MMKQSSSKVVKVGVVPLGEVSAVVSRVIADNIYAFLDLQADILPRLPMPIHALDRGRMQFDAAQILKILEKEEFSGYDKIIGVFSADLFVPIFTYVLGEARQSGRCALVSIFRLDEKGPSGSVETSQLLERCVKVALHELGHLFDLTHCSDPRCLMHISSDALDLDQRHISFCRYCSMFFRQSLHLHGLNQDTRI
jgi:archaemetzincin